MTSTSTSPTITSLHPYFPEDLHLSGDNFTPNTWNVLLLVSVFGGGWAVILGLTFAFVRREKLALRISDQFVVLWFVLSEL
jgi:cholestenol Delta-isomerase